MSDVLVEEISRLNEDLRRVAEFHGHVCPGLIYGYRAAKAALSALGARAVDEELVAIVENDSCAVDAIQVLTGCSFGKGNLIFRDYGKSVYTFLNRDTGQGVRISVDFREEESPEDNEVLRKYMSGDRSDEVVKDVARRKARKVRAILEAPQELVLTIRPVSETPPPRARIFPSGRCSTCGEKVMEPRLRLQDGKPVCLACLESA